jgi:predicted dienelactone hydrolase
MTKYLPLLVFAGACCSRLTDAPAKKIGALPPLPTRAYVVNEEHHVWHDAKRNRSVPVKLYIPSGVDRRAVVVFSHGIGEDREAYVYLGRALARSGFTAAHITHAGTDRAVLQQGYRHLYEATRHPVNWINRPLDVSFVLDQLGASDALVAGHSAGAFTAFAVAGTPLGRGETFRDPRVRAIIPMSMPRLDEVIPPRGYDAVAVPALNITGTCDGSLIYRTLPRHRRLPFDSSRAAKQYLVTIRGVNHNSFSNVEDAHHDVIARLTVLFARAWLNGDQDARAWFDDAGSTGEMTVEKK